MVGLHPIFAHFAIVLPVVTLIMVIYHLKVKSITSYNYALALAIASALAMIAAWYTGGIDGKAAYEGLMIGKDGGVEELMEHKQLGTVLAVFLAAVVVMMKVSAVKENRYLMYISIVSLAVVVGLTFIQGKHGGELVYEYAANVELPVDEDDEEY
jgi:uncharacterized membrane protein